MIEEMGGVNSQLIGLALDAALLRHEVIANNIANVNTPGYSAKRLSFEEHLAGFSSALQQAGNSLNNELLSTRIEALKAALNDGNTLVVPQNETVELDREMVRLTENNLRYQALLQAGGKRGELLSMAIREGRR